MRIKNFKSIFLLVAIFFSFSENIWAAQVLTWNDCVQEAIAHHPDIVAAGAKLDQTKADKSIAKSNALPQINANAVGKESQTGGKENIEAYSYSISARQLLFDGFKTSNAIKQANQNITADEYNYMVISSDVRLNLKQAFSGLLKAQELILLTQSIAERRAQNLKLIKLRYQAGREHKGSLLTAEADLANAEFEVEQASRNLSLAQTTMVKALGWQKLEPIKVIGDFENNQSIAEIPDFEFLADQTPLLKEFVAKKDAARFNLKSKKNDFFPEIYLDSSIGQSGSDWAPEDDDWMVGVSVSLPLFEGGNRIAQVSKAKASMKQATAQEQSGRDSILIALEETWSAYQDALGTVLVKKKFLEAGEERAKIANAQYSSGLITFDDWIIIEDNLVETKKSYLNAQANVLVNEAQWVQAKGGILEYEN
ncbi:MAG: TolC family protein [Candidatus Omnitrophica bacterium]|nr:TolC family protein [Candidatus Omnitrophota bacterium]